MRESIGQKSWNRPGVLLSIVVLLIAIGVIIFDALKDGDQLSSISVFLTFLATACGAILITYELHAAKLMNKAQAILELNNRFHENEALMGIYESLERENRVSNGGDNFKAVSRADFAAFLDFFENLAYLYYQKVLEIRDIDPLFHYRFFSFMHCKWIQEEHLFPTAASYRSIFELYQDWLGYRDRHKEFGPVVGADHRLSEAYLTERVYLSATPIARTLVGYVEVDGVSLDLVSPSFSDISSILTLQMYCVEESVSAIEYVPLTRDELIDSLHRDKCILVEEGGQPVAFAISIPPRESVRNLGLATGLHSWEEVVTFDIVFVHPEYRGLGLHRRCLDLCLEEAKRVGAQWVLSCTSESNEYSRNNFASSGFRELGTTLFYGAYPRIIYGKEVV